MGSLSDVADDMPAPDPGDIRGAGSRLVDWWDQADDADRALFRTWAVPRDAAGYRPAHEIADALTAAGWAISARTVLEGIRLLRRHRWAS